MKADLEEFRNRYPDGVRGSFVLNLSGIVVEQELPGFSKLNIAKISRDIKAMHDALMPAVRRARVKEHNIILRFDTIIVYCRRLRGGMLVVLAAHDANVTTLRALSNLLIGSIEERLEERAGTA